jgi:hypothetical protein
MLIQYLFLCTLSCDVNTAMKLLFTFEVASKLKCKECILIVLGEYDTIVRGFITTGHVQLDSIIKLVAMDNLQHVNKLVSALSPFNLGINLNFP